MGATKAPPKAGETLNVDAYFMNEHPEQSILERLKANQITELYIFLISFQSRSSSFQIIVANCTTFSNFRILRSQIKWIYYKFMADSSIIYGLMSFLYNLWGACTWDWLKCWNAPATTSFVFSRPRFLQASEGKGECTYLQTTVFICTWKNFYINTICTYNSLHLQLCAFST